MDTWLYKLIITRILQIYFTFATGTLHYIGILQTLKKVKLGLLRCAVYPTQFQRVVTPKRWRVEKNFIRQN